MMSRLELVEEEDAELADVLGMRLVVSQAAGETARAHQELPSCGIVAMRLFSRKGFAGDLLEQAFANADAGDAESAQIQVAAEGDEGDGGNAHDVGAIAAHRVGLHALAHVPLQNGGQTLAQERKLYGEDTVFARAGGNRGER